MGKRAMHQYAIPDELKRKMELAKKAHQPSQPVPTPAREPRKADLPDTGSKPKQRRTTADTTLDNMPTLELGQDSVVVLSSPSTTRDTGAKLVKSRFNRSLHDLCLQTQTLIRRRRARGAMSVALCSWIHQARCHTQQPTCSPPAQVSTCFKLRPQALLGWPGLLQHGLLHEGARPLAANGGGGTKPQGQVNAKEADAKLQEEVKQVEAKPKPDNVQGKANSAEQVQVETKLDNVQGKANSPEQVQVEMEPDNVPAWHRAGRGRGGAGHRAGRGRGGAGHRAGRGRGGAGHCARRAGQRQGGGGHAG